LKIYPEAFEAVKEFASKGNEFEGRVADQGINLVLLASMVANAGDGDHVEIGTLFGASAITVGIMKRILGLKGDIYCIDPYEPEERAKNVSMKKGDQTLLSASPKALLKNAELYDLEIKLIQEYSDPWPEELKDNTFATSYIDGDHVHDMPYTDFLNLRGRTESYIGFDNYEEGYPDVIGGVNRVLSEDKDWVLWYKNSTFVALRRRLPGRNMGNTPITAL